MQKGSIGVTTTNIFPVIKQFLYSDHEIFLREIVSNAVDATQKLKTLAVAGEFNGNTDDLKVEVKVDKEAGTLTISDNGIGMTAEEIDKYINQIAFSGAEEFVKKYKDNASAIIGHFGLGFYSAFMVSKKVEIHTLSYKEGAKPVCWVCDGSPEYEMGDCEKAERGTDIILFLTDDDKEYLENTRINGLLSKYCRFLPVPIVFGKEQEWKDGKYVDTDKDKVINDVEPLWTRTPTELKDEDYINFYHAIEPGQDDPLFWIHLNVDYPFNLTGILYFPKIKSNLDIRKDRIKLYCNQVYVTDSVEGVIPEFLTLLQGVIDSPDIPLNVSRSYLQADRNVKKISSYITKKVASRLEEISKADAKVFEQKWNDIKIFIEYGMLSDDKFYDSATKFALFENTDGNFFKFDDYKKTIESNQTDKDGNLIYLYATDKVAQYSYIKSAKDKGYDVLLMDGQLDIPFVGKLEEKFEKSRFVRVDSDVIDNLVQKENSKDSNLGKIEREIASTLFSSQMPSIEKTEFTVKYNDLGENDNAVIITQNEYMRRMKEMAKFQPGMSFYGEFPTTYDFTLNTSHPVVKKVIDSAVASLGKDVEPIDNEIDKTNAEIKAIHDIDKDNKGIPEDKKAELKELENKAEELRNKKVSIISAYSKDQSTVKQLVDIALLGNGLLKGKDLTEFLKRSVDLLNK